MVFGLFYAHKNDDSVFAVCVASVLLWMKHRCAAKKWTSSFVHKNGTKHQGAVFESVFQSSYTVGAPLKLALDYKPRILAPKIEEFPCLKVS